MRWFGWALVGALAAFLYTFLQSRSAVAQTTVFFPAVHPQPFLQLTRALKEEPGQQLDTSRIAQGNPEIPPLARLILHSRSAAQAVLAETKVSTRASMWKGDPVDSLLSRFHIEVREPGGLALELESSNAGLAQAQLQKFLDYYTAYVAKNPLTRVQRSRAEVETRLASVAKYLSVLEEKMRRSNSADLRQLGDAAIRANPKVMKELWLKRLEEEGSSRELLDKLQKIRGQSKGAPQDPWMAEWSKGKKDRSTMKSPLLRLPVRSSDLLARAKIEREYYEALLLHRSLVLQQSFLLTWEKLESPAFEIVDPVSVKLRRPPWTRNLFLGLLLGSLGWLLARGSGRRSRYAGQH